MGMIYEDYNCSKIQIVITGNEVSTMGPGALLTSLEIFLFYIDFWVITLGCFTAVSSLAS